MTDLVSPATSRENTCEKLRAANRDIARRALGAHIPLQLRAYSLMLKNSDDDFDEWDTVHNQYLGNSATVIERPELPRHVVFIKGQANDTELPGLYQDGDNQEISFEWRGMSEAFFSEEAEHKARDVIRRRKRWTPRNATEQVLFLYESNLLVRKDVRRERLTRVFRAKGQANPDYWEDWYMKRERRAMRWIAEPT